jgi:hypothetical protein
VVLLVGDLGEDRVARLEELQAVERDREVVLRDLLVALVVARLAVDHALQHERGLAPAFGVEEALALRRLLRHLAGGHRTFIRRLVKRDLSRRLLRRALRGRRRCSLLRLGIPDTGSQEKRGRHKADTGQPDSHRRSSLSAT